MFLESRGDNPEAYLVVLQNQRPISNELARALGVRHESPQVLVVRDGKAQKVLNHFQITAERLAEALERE